VKKFYRTTPWTVLVALLVALSLTGVGCQGDDGDTGPAGTSGAIGPQGPSGATASDVTVTGNTGSDVTTSALGGVANKDLTIEVRESDGGTVVTSTHPAEDGSFQLVFAAGPLVEIVFMNGTSEVGRLSNIASAAAEGGVIELGTITIVNGTATAEIAPPLVGSADYIITINYELGMHCTGFDFSYCCVLPLFNSVQAQVVKVGAVPTLMQKFAKDGDGKATLLVDGSNAYKLAYDFVDNSFSEGSKLIDFRALYDANGDGDTTDETDNIGNVQWTHLYIYSDLEGTPGADTAEANKLFDGNQIVLSTDQGPLGAGLSGYLTNAGPTGTVVYTKTPVVENTPIVLTNPGIWDAVGLTLTPFLDSELAGRSFLDIQETDVQPYQMARVRMLDAATGAPVINTKGQPISFVGTEPIDIPNCASCHGIEVEEVLDTPNLRLKDAGDLPVDDPNHSDAYAKVIAERTYWQSLGSSDYIDRIKAAAVSILGLHDLRVGTSFLDHYNSVGTLDPDTGTTNRLGHDPIQCQKCHADNVAGWLAAGAVMDTVAADDDAICAAKGDGNTPCMDVNDDPADHTTYKAKVVDYANIDGAYRQNDLTVNGVTVKGGRDAVRDYLRKDVATLIAQTAGQLEVRGLPGRPPGAILIEPITEAIHFRHINNRPLPDADGRTGGCQGCHPAHRQDRSLDGYPITFTGQNFYGDTNGDGLIDDTDGDQVHHDNRDAAGGCYVGRDVHSNPRKDEDGAQTPEHLNAVGQWIRANVSRGFDYDTGRSNMNPNGERKGLWCTNCHNELSRVLYKADNLAAGEAHDPDAAHTVRDATDLDDLATQLNAATDDFGTPLTYPTSAMIGGGSDVAFTADLLKSMIDPRVNHTGVGAAAVGASGVTDWTEDKDGDGIDDVAAAWLAPFRRGGSTGIAVLNAWTLDSTDSTKIVDLGFSTATTTVNGIPVSTLTALPAEAGLPFAATDSDGDVTVNIENGNPRATSAKPDTAVVANYETADDAGDYWLSVGAPHCADCHAAPFNEGQGGVAFPINQPGKYSLMRYSKGHHGLSCQACHQSIHGLYPVTPGVDQTTYAQAAALNPDGSHGPIKCAACHGADNVNTFGVPTVAAGKTVAYDLDGDGTIAASKGEDAVDITTNFDAAVTWIHQTAEDNGGADSDIEEVENPLNVTPVCGNGTVEGSEQCDDGNTTDGDGCSATCTTEAGAVTEPQVYKDNCESCHGQNGEGGAGPALAGATLDRSVVRNGGATIMPAFDAGAVSDADLDAIDAWLLTL